MVTCLQHDQIKSITTKSVLKRFHRSAPTRIWRKMLEKQPIACFINIPATTLRSGHTRNSGSNTTYTLRQIAERTETAFAREILHCIYIFFRAHLLYPLNCTTYHVWKWIRRFLTSNRLNERKEIPKGHVDKFGKLNIKKKKIEPTMDEKKILKVEKPFLLLVSIR